MDSSITIDELEAALDAALRSVIDPEEFDIVRSPAGELEVSTDDWTLHVEVWPDGLAWLAIDDEPEDPARYTPVRRQVMSEAVDRALAEADRAVNGALTRALAASGDPFSLDFSAAIAAQGGQQDDHRLLTN